MKVRTKTFIKELLNKCHPNCANFAYTQGKELYYYQHEKFEVIVYMKTKKRKPKRFNWLYHNRAKRGVDNLPF